MLLCCEITVRLGHPIQYFLFPLFLYTFQKLFHVNAYSITLAYYSCVQSPLHTVVSFLNFAYVFNCLVYSRLRRIQAQFMGIQGISFKRYWVIKITLLNYPGLFWKPWPIGHRFRNYIFYNRPLYNLDGNLESSRAVLIAL